jgi:beta-glucosidase
VFNCENLRRKIAFARLEISIMKLKSLTAASLLTVQFLSFASLTFAQNGARDDFSDSGAFLQKTVVRPSAKRSDAAKIEALLRKMSVEEKVGQMTQLTIDMVTSGEHQDVRIDSVKLEKAVNRYGVGSILNVNNQALPIERWHEIITGIQTAAMKNRHKIPVIYVIDSIHGAN